VRGPAALRLLPSAALLLAAAAPCAAQVDASLDAAASVVKYDGYLVSSAVSLSPAVAWQSARTILAARGSFLLFESGNTSIQGLLSAATWSPALGRFRVEAGGEAGASAYAGFARFAHALGRVRLHAMGQRYGAWAGPLAGGLSRGSGSDGVAGASAGAWLRFAGGGVEASWTRLTVGDTAFSDVVGRARWRAGAFDMAATAGTRVGSRGGGTGLYGDVSLTARVADWLALVLAGGTYPSDPVRGSIPGRYLAAGVRLAPRAPPRTAVIAQVGPTPRSDARGPGALVDRARVTVERVDGVAVLVVRVTGAYRIEVMGDFTDWRAVPLAASGSDRYRYAIALAPGMYRFNLRLDGGPWGVPLGAGRATDEFGGSVGVLVVP